MQMYTYIHLSKLCWSCRMWEYWELPLVVCLWISQADVCRSQVGVWHGLPTALGS